MRCFMAAPVTPVAQVTLADDAPVGQKIAPVAGMGGKAARFDHAHPSNASVTEHATLTTGEAAIVFARTFSKKPAVECIPEEATDLGALTYKVKGWTKDAQNQITGCTVKFYRIQGLPSSLLVLSALVSFRVDMGMVGAVSFICNATEQSS